MKKKYQIISEIRPENFNIYVIRTNEIKLENYYEWVENPHLENNIVTFNDKNASIENHKSIKHVI